MDAVLETRSLCKSFGALTVAQSIDFRLRPGDRHALIGPNGAGKTTFVNMLMGALRPSSGRILLGGDDVTRAPQAQRVKRGLGRTFQINSLFRNLPVLDNVALAVAERRRIALRMWRAAGSYKEIIEEATQLLATLGLADDLTTRIIDLPTASSAWWRSRSRSAAAQGAAARRAGGRRAVVGGRADPAAPGKAALRNCDPDHRARHGLVFRFARRITVLVQVKCCWRARRRKLPATGASTTSTSASSTMADALKLEPRARGLRPDRGAGRCRPRPAGARRAGCTGAQRRRQDHAARDHHGHTTFHSGEILLSEKSISRLPVTSARAWRRLRAAGARDLPVAQRRGEPRRRARPGRWTLERVYDLFPRLAERRSHQGNQISGGEQQMLAIGRALMGNPSLMLMDDRSKASPRSSLNLSLEH